jgi:hypothetical protein
MDLDMILNSSGINLYKNNSNFNFSKLEIFSEDFTDSVGGNTNIGDFDNDGDLDLLVSSDSGKFWERKFSEQSIVLLNNGDGTFTLTEANTILNGGGICSIADYNNDGNLDVFVVSGLLGANYANYLYSNDGTGNNWLEIDCEGTTSNRSAIGARIKIKATINGKSYWQMRELAPPNGVYTYNSQRFHFGLGNSETIDSILICWPSGNIDTIVNVPANTFYKAKEKHSFVENLCITNYILLKQPIPDVKINSPEQPVEVDLADYFTFKKGKTVPEITGDTIEYAIRSNSEDDKVITTLEGSRLFISANTNRAKADIKVTASNNFTGNFDEIKVTADFSTAINNTTNPPIISIYPNPANNIVYFNITSIELPVLVQISSLSGNLLYHQWIDSEQGTINIGSLNPGIYVIKATNNRKTSATRLVVD